MKRLVTVLRVLDEIAEILVFRVLLRPRWRWTVVTTLSALVLVFWAVGPSRPGGASHVALPSPASAVTTTDVSAAEDPVALLRERPWVDAIPRKDTDAFNLYFFGHDRFKNGEIGVFLSGTPMKWTTELFAYRLERGRIAFFFPANNEQAQSGFAVKQERHGEFDLMLELASDARRGRARQTYFSSTDWDGSALDTAPVTAAMAAVQVLSEPR